MSKFQSALIIVVALSAVALVATAAARFVSPAKAPKMAERRNAKRRTSNKTKRAVPQDSQLLQSAKAIEVVYPPCPVFTRSEPITCSKKTSVLQVPIYIPLPTFPHTQHALFQTGADQKADFATNIAAIGPAGVKQ
ncbi:hypothetical protein HDU80_010384, partial [Chytriomyces hyalinus]